MELLAGPKVVSGALVMNHFQANQEFVMSVPVPRRPEGLAFRLRRSESLRRRISRCAVYLP